MEKIKKHSIILLSALAIIMLCVCIAFGIPFISHAEEPTPAAETTNVAAIGSTQYSTLEAAIDAATSKSTVVNLLKDVEYSARLTITKSCTINLNKHTITFNVAVKDPSSTEAPPSSTMFLENANIDLTVQNGTIKNTQTNTNVPTLFVNAAKSLTLTNVTVDSASKYGIYYYNHVDSSKAAIKITNCTVSSRQYGIYINKSLGTVNVTGCKITVRSSVTSSYGMYISGSTGAKTFKNNTIISTTTADKSYNLFGIYLTASCSGTTTISNTSETYDFTAGIVNDDASYSFKTHAGYGICDFGAGNTEITGELKFNNCQTGIYIWKVPEGTQEAKTSVYSATIKGADYGIANSGTGPLTVYKSTIDVAWYGINGNGGKHGTDMTVTDTTIIAQWGIYHPQDGTLVVDGGTITAGQTGIEMRGGKLTVKNGTAITVPQDVVPSHTNNSNGTAVVGAGIAVAQHTTNKPISVTVENAKINAPQVFAQYDVETINKEPCADIEVKITGGEFVGAVETDRVQHFISGGEFLNSPDSIYLVEGYDSYHESNNMNLVSPDVGPAKLEAHYYVMLYAATWNIKYPDNIKNIIFDDTIITLDGVEEAKVKAIAAVDEIRNTLEKAKKDAIKAINDAAATIPATEPDGEAQGAVEVPYSVYAAINDATDAAEVEALMNSELAEIQAKRELAQAKKSAIEEIKEAAKAKPATEPNGEALKEVVVPTATFAAIDAATDTAKVNELKLNALNEIEEKRKADKQASDLDTKVDGVTDKVDGIGTKVDGVTDKVDGIEDKVDGIEDKVDGLDTKVDGVTDKVDGIDTKVDGIEDKVDGIDGNKADGGTSNGGDKSVSLKPVYVMLGIVIALAVGTLILVIILLAKNRHDDDPDEGFEDENNEENAPGEAPTDGKNEQAAVAQNEQNDEADEEPDDEVPEEEEEPDDDAEDEDGDGHEEEGHGVDMDNIANVGIAANADMSRLHRKPTKSFEERLREAPAETLEMYSMIKNEFCGYENVKNRMCRTCESFRIGNKLVAKIKISTKSIRLYLALDPAAYDEKKYRHIDKSETKAYAHVPMMVKVYGPRSVGRAQHLIADCVDGAKRDEAYYWVDYAELIKQEAAQTKETQE